MDQNCAGPGTGRAALAMRVAGHVRPADRPDELAVDINAPATLLAVAVGDAVPPV